MPGQLSWHPKTKFTGAGLTEKYVLFSYHSNWEAPGRWAIEFLKRRNRYYLKPMKILQKQALGSVILEPVDIDDQLDQEFKPGFYHQTKAFINDDTSRFCSLINQEELLKTFI